MTPSHATRPSLLARNGLAGALLGLGLLPAAALAGDLFTNSVQNGTWSDPATWDAGVPSLAVVCIVEHEVTVSSPGAETGILEMAYDGPASVHVQAGADLETFDIGFGTFDATLLIDGDVTVFQRVDAGGSFPTVHVRDGSLTVGDDLRFETAVGESTMIMEGAAATVTVSDQVKFGVNSAFVVRPTGNGASGLTTLHAGHVLLNSTPTIELDTSLYAPAVGDSWEVLVSSGSFAGSFTNLVAPPGYAFELDNPVFNTLRLTVTDAPSPWVDLGGGTLGVAGQPLLTLSGPLTVPSDVTLDLVDGAPAALALIFVSFASTPTPFLGGTLHTFPFAELVILGTDGAGEIHGATPFPGAPSGSELSFQVALEDASVPLFGGSLSNGVVGTVP